MTWRKTGFALIALGLVPWGLWTLLDSSRTWFFADNVPIVLSNGSHYSTGTIKPNMSTFYDIYINADVPKGIGGDQSTGALREIACQVGANNPEKDRCPNPPLWRFKWTLTNDGRTIDQGSSETTRGWINSVTGITLNLGEFKTEAGHRYKFDLDMLFDNRDPRVTNPRLMIAAGGQPAASSMFISGLLGVVCGAIGSVGGLIILGSFLHQWSRHRRAKELPES